MLPSGLFIDFIYSGYNEICKLNLMDFMFDKYIL